MLKKQVVGAPEAQAWGAASAFFLFFTGIFAFTWLDVPFICPTETFSLEVHTKGNTFVTIGWGSGYGTVALLVPLLFACKSLHLIYLENIQSVVVSHFAIHLHYARYRQLPHYPSSLLSLPRAKKRTIEEIDLLFAFDKPWVWEAEKEFACPKLEHVEMLHGATDDPAMDEEVDARNIEGSAYPSA